MRTLSALSSTSLGSPASSASPWTKESVLSRRTCFAVDRASALKLCERNTHTGINITRASLGHRSTAGSYEGRVKLPSLSRGRTPGASRRSDARIKGHTVCEKTVMIECKYVYVHLSIYSTVFDRKINTSSTPASTRGDSSDSGEVVSIAGRGIWTSQGTAGVFEIVVVNTASGGDGWSRLTQSSSSSASLS